MQVTQSPAPAYQDDEIDLRQLVKVLWQQKSLILGAGILGTALGLGGSLLSTQYVTEALLLTPPAFTAIDGDPTKQKLLGAADYKRYESALFSGSRLEEFLRVSAQADTADGQRLQKIALRRDGLRDSVKPEFALTDKDQKAFGIKPNSEEQNALLGMRLRYADGERSSGTPLNLLAEYVREVIIKVDVADSALKNCATYATRAQELRNQQLEYDFAIRQEAQRINGLRDIIARNPNVGATETRQIVSLEKGTERFLSPAAQLVAAEIQVADLKLAEARRERERIASELKHKYYCDAEAALKQPVTGRSLLADLRNIQVAAFEGRDRTTDIVEQTWNELELERERWNNIYLSGMRFVAPPEGTEVRERKPSLALGLVLGGVLGGMLGVMLALVRGWWRGEGADPE